MPDQFQTFYAGKRHQRGFTLTECLLSGLILAMASGVFAAGMSLSARTVRDSRDREQAAVFLDMLLNKIALIGPEAMLYEAPSSGELDERFSWDVYIEETDVIGLYEVSLTVYWRIGDGANTRRKKAHAVTMLYESSSEDDLLLDGNQELTDGDLFEEMTKVTWEDLP